MQPQKVDWIAAVQRAIEAAPAPVILIGHSLGCVTIAHWATQADAQTLAKVRAALLVAPADVERADCPQALQNFAPLAVQGLAFPSLLVGSSNDSAATPVRTQWLAKCWGSELVILPGAGHINVKSGHRLWEQGFAWLYRLQGRSERRSRQSA
jgi:predicted alpha/beta hydrolase family esterase